MTWFKIDDGITEHPKTRGLTFPEFGLFIESLAYCSRNLTDGQFPRSEVKLWLARRGGTRVSRQVDGILKAGCWREVDSETLEVVDYLQHQRSRSDVEKERSAAAERQRKSRQRHGVTHGEVTRLETETETETETEVVASSGHSQGASSESMTRPDIEDQVAELADSKRAAF